MAELNERLKLAQGQLAALIVVDDEDVNHLYFSLHTTTTADFTFEVGGNFALVEAEAFVALLQAGIDRVKENATRAAERANQ